MSIALTLVATAQLPSAVGTRAAEPKTSAAQRGASRPRSLLQEASPQVLAAGLPTDPASLSSAAFEVRELAPPQRNLLAPGASGLTGAAPVPRVYEVTIHPGAGYTEKFLFQEVVASTPKPLLVVFHKFGNSAYDVLQNTTYFEEARRRGWYCVAPLSASGVHFSSLESQINTEAVIRWVVNHFSIDRTRVWGVGFSMGGGAALNYAARHLDPNGVMLAAVVNISGTVSIKDVYFQDPAVQYILDFWFGNNTPGSASPWEMERSSVVSFDPLTLAVETGNDLARNLMHLNTRTVRATGDIPYLITQNDVLHARFLALGAGAGQHGLYVLNYAGHDWDMVPERSVCDWLRTQRLVLPTAGNTLADVDERYFYFDIVQDAAGAFTPFTWSVVGATNTVALTATANLQRATLDVSDAGLSSSQPLTLQLGTADGLADEVRVADWPQTPIAVLRDGVATALWSYDALAGVVTLSEFDGGAHTWVVMP